MHMCAVCDSCSSLNLLRITLASVWAFAERTVSTGNGSDRGSHKLRQLSSKPGTHSDAKARASARAILPTSREKVFPRILGRIRVTPHPFADRLCSGAAGFRKRHRGLAPNARRRGLPRRRDARQATPACVSGEAGILGRNRVLIHFPVFTEDVRSNFLGRICFIATKTVYYPFDCIICIPDAYSVDTMQKKARHDSIIEMISATPVRSQSELAAMLAARGYSVTQASVSRDLDVLGVTKIGGRYVRSVPGLSNGIAARATFETAGPHMIVGKCASGLASAITVRIDSMKFPEIVGTIAGDDTIMIAVRSAEAQAAALDRLNEMFGG